MAVNTQDDVDRTLVASAAGPIRYHSFNNFRRIVARHPMTLPSVADFLEDSDGDAGVTSDNAERILAQTYPDRPPAAELVAATRPIYQAAPAPAYVSVAATGEAPAVTRQVPAVTREPLSRLATPEPFPGLSHTALGHSPAVAPPLASNFVYHAVHLAAGPAVPVPMQQYQQPLGPIQAPMASYPVEAPHVVQAARPAEVPVPTQASYPEPATYAAPPQPLPQQRILPAAPLSPPAATWHMLGRQPVPEPLPRPAPGRLGSVEDLFRVLAGRSEPPAPVAPPLPSAPARWYGTDAAQSSAAAAPREPDTHVSSPPAQGPPLSRFAFGQHNPAQMRPTPGAAALRFASQRQPVLRPEPESGVGELFRRL